MKTIRQLALLMFIDVLLSACGGNTITEIAVTDAPTLTSIPPPYPTDIPTSIPVASLPSGFPYAPTLSDDLHLEGLVLAAHMYADNTCYDLGIYQDGHYSVLSCFPGFTYSTSTGFLEEYELSYLNRWADHFQSFEEPSAQGLLKFVGKGEVAPEFAEKISMRAMVGEIEWVAHGYIHKGGWPSAVHLARTLLSHQLGVSLDDKSVFKFEVVDFPDNCLGAPKPDEVCAQVVTPGFRVQLVAQGMLYEFHTDVRGYAIRQFGEPKIAPTQGPAG